MLTLDHLLLVKLDASRRYRGTSVLGDVPRTRVTQFGRPSEKKVPRTRVTQFGRPSEEKVPRTRVTQLGRPSEKKVLASRRVARAASRSCRVFREAGKQSGTLDLRAYHLEDENQHYPRTNTITNTSVQQTDCMLAGSIHRCVAPTTRAASAACAVNS